MKRRLVKMMVNILADDAEMKSSLAAVKTSTSDPGSEMTSPADTVTVGVGLQR